MATRQSRPKNKPRAPPNSATTAVTRSASEYPTLSEANLLLSTEKSTGSKSQPERRSQTEQPQRRTTLRSVLPDSALLIPVSRPAQYGKIGKHIKIFTNHFKVAIPNTTVNQYDIEIEFVRDDGKTSLARKDERRQVFNEITKEKHFPIAWYDEGSNLYTKELLADFEGPRLVKLKINGEVKTFQFQIKNLVRLENMRSISDFITGKTFMRPKDPIRVLETLLKQSIRTDYCSIRNRFFNRQQRLIDLRDGRGLASGFHQALCLTKLGPTLNVNLAFTCFYHPLNFVDFACAYLRKDITTGFSKFELAGAEKLFQKMAVETTHRACTNRYRIQGFGENAENTTFTLNRSDEASEETSETKISVANYFAQRYEPLTYPKLPCIDVRKEKEDEGKWLPMEVVKVVEWQRAQGPLDTKQRELVSKNTIIRPDRRYDEIMKIVSQRKFNTDIYLKEMNVKVDISEMLQIKARILPPPTVAYRDRGQTVVVDNVAVGKWNIRNCFYNSPTVNVWGMMYFGRKPDNRIKSILQEFESALPPLLGKVGIVLQSKPVKIAKPDSEDDVEAALRQASTQKWQLAIVILNEVQSNIYNYIKQTGNQRLGVVTQCVNFSLLAKNSGNLQMYIQNLSQKINVKIGGINGVVNLRAALSRSRNEDLFMFFGAGLSHTNCSKRTPSIAAVVGSCDPTGTRYAARLSKQYPKTNRCSLEIIKELDKMVIELLQVFARSCANHLPNRIVFYRGGVDDGQFQKVLDNEVNLVKHACRIVYGNRPLPSLTFIIVKRRHQTRFLAYDGQCTTNISAGTVIDDDITHPSQFDFYLCSQGSLLGTTRPALYHVLHDENEFTSDDIQQLTYWMCHIDARCTKSVSVPAPVHYADLAARAAHMYEFRNRDTPNEESDDDNVDEDGAVATNLDEIKSKVVFLNERIHDQMWFV